MVKYTLMLIGSFLVRTVPLKLSYKISEALAELAHSLDKKRRENCASNLRLITGRAQVYDLTRSVFKHLAKNTVDFLRFPHLSRAQIAHMTDTEGLENLRKALSKGKGVILISPHLGNWELGGAVLASLGFPVSVVTESIAPKTQIVKRQRIAGLYENYRTKTGMKVIPLEKGAVPVYRALRRGEIVVLLADRDLTGSGVSVRFFGRKVCFPQGPAFFSSKTGSPIVPGYLVRKGSTYIGVAEPALQPDEEGGIDSLAQQISDTVQSQIREYPDQWFVFGRIEEGL